MNNDRIFLKGNEIVTKPQLNEAIATEHAYTQAMGIEGYNERMFTTDIQLSSSSDENKAFVTWLEEFVIPKINGDFLTCRINLPRCGLGVIKGIAYMKFTEVTNNDDGSIKVKGVTYNLIKDSSDTTYNPTRLYSYSRESYFTIKDDKIISYHIFSGGGGGAIMASYLSTDVNYDEKYFKYTPTNAYHPATKKYVDDSILTAIGSISSFSLLPVDVLPTENIQTNVIYAVPSDDPKEKDVRIEYVYINDDWEVIGSTKIDLSNYYTKAEIDAKFEQIMSILPIATADEVADILNGEVTE